MRNLLDNPAFGLIGILVPLVGLLVVAFVAYWAIRLGVRHGVLDAERRRGGPAGRPSDGGPVPWPDRPPDPWCAIVEMIHFPDPTGGRGADAMG